MIQMTHSDNINELQKRVRLSSFYCMDFYHWPLELEAGFDKSYDFFPGLISYMVEIELANLRLAAGDPQKYVKYLLVTFEGSDWTPTAMFGETYAFF